MEQNNISIIDDSLYSQAADVLSLAFKDDPVAVAIYNTPNPMKRIKYLNRFFKTSVEICGRLGLPVYIKSNSKVSGVALIYPPKTIPRPLHVQLKILFAVITNHTGVARSLLWGRAIEKRHPKEPHYYLEYIGIDQSQQGKGLGSSLLRYLTSLADRDNVGCFLETGNPKNLPLYQEFGFQPVYMEEIIGVKVWFMWRGP